MRQRDWNLQSSSWSAWKKDYFLIVAHSWNGRNWRKNGGSVMWGSRVLKSDCTSPMPTADSFLEPVPKIWSLVLSQISPSTISNYPYLLMPIADFRIVT